MQITSSDFANLETIPDTFGRSFDNVNPSLTFSDIPDGTVSLSLIVEDHDSPNGVFTHWIVYNISPADLQIIGGESSMSGEVGRNDFGEIGYGGPQPNEGTHRYTFKLMAVDTMIEVSRNLDRTMLYERLDGHIIEEAELIGTFTRK